MAARRAADFLEEIRLQWKQRSSVLPEMGELAERFARHLLGDEHVGVSVIHATGVVLGSSEILPPLADVAMQTMFRTIGEYHGAHQELAFQTGQLLQDLTGAEAAWVASNRAGASYLAQTALPASVELIDASFSGLVNPSRFGLASIATIQETLSGHLQGETDLISVDAAGMLGGPQCGILLGKKNLVDQLQEHQLASCLAPGPLTLAALASTLKLYQTPDQVIHQIPVLQLLSTPMENLRQRAERLALLMEQSEAVAEATPQESESIWCQTATLHHAAPTWVISLRPKSDEAAPIAAGRLQDRLRQSETPVLSRIADDRVVLDLRTLFPRWDQPLVTAVVG